jgi:hypothetical protein
MTDFYDWDSFVSSVNDDGRGVAYLFQWTMPPLEILGCNADYKLRSASIPESTVEELSTFWMGQQYKAGGARRFNDWTVTIMCDNNSLLQNIRFRFEVWMQEINLVLYNGSLVNSIPILGDLTGMKYGKGETTGIEGLLNFEFDLSIGYYRPQVLQMLDGEGNETCTVILVDSWPKSIGAITLDHSSGDWAQFDVTFSYMYHMIGTL